MAAANGRPRSPTPQTADDNRGQVCNYGGDTPGQQPISKCFGTANATLLSLGGTVYYRFNRNWFGLASLFITQDTVEGQTGLGATANLVKDSPITGVTGFLRVAYRF